MRGDRAELLLAGAVHAEKIYTRFACSFVIIAAGLIAVAIGFTLTQRPNAFLALLLAIFRIGRQTDGDRLVDVFSFLVTDYEEVKLALFTVPAEVNNSDIFFEKDRIQLLCLLNQLVGGFLIGLEDVGEYDQALGIVAFQASCQLDGAIIQIGEYVGVRPTVEEITSVRCEFVKEGKNTSRRQGGAEDEERGGDAAEQATQPRLETVDGVLTKRFPKIRVDNKQADGMMKRSQKRSKPRPCVGIGFDLGSVVGKEQKKCGETGEDYRNIVYFGSFPFVPLHKRRDDQDNAGGGETDRAKERTDAGKHRNLL